MDEIPWVPIAVAAIGSGGLAVFAREIADLVNKVRNGVSARESKRKNDIITQRDAALARAEAAEARADREIENRRRLFLFAAHLQRALILAGGTEMPWPEIDETTDLPKREEP